MEENLLNEITVHKVRKDYEDEIINLMLDGFEGKNKEKLTEQYRYLNYSNPNQNFEPIGIVAIHKNRVVSYRGFSSIPFIVGSMKINALLPVGAVTQTDYLRKGLFGMLNKEAYNMYHDNADFFLSTSSNKYSAPGYIKQNWKVLGAKDYYYRKQFWVRHHENVLFKKDIPIEIILNINKDSIFANDTKIRLDLSSTSFINWIFGQNGYQCAIITEGNMPKAYCCYTISGKQCNLIHFDMLYNDDSLSQMLNEIASKYSVNLFICYGKKMKSLRQKVLERSGFWSSNHRSFRKIIKKEIMPLLIKKTEGMHNTNDFKVEGIDASDLNNWDITMLSNI